MDEVGFAAWAVAVKTDLHVHTTCSDGAMPVAEVVAEAARRGIGALSLTDHDSVDGQEVAVRLAQGLGIAYVPGVELNVTLPYEGGKQVSLDFLGYGFDFTNRALRDKLAVLKEHREGRARQIMQNLNAEFAREGILALTEQDMRSIQEGVDGALGRPHIANYLVQKGIVGSRQEAFDRYLVKCDVPKYPLSPEEASALVRGAGGLMVLAHPDDPNGTSLRPLAAELPRQGEIIERRLLPYLDGVECWHSRATPAATEHYLAFARRHRLLMSGGSDCHQKPVLMGTVDIPEWVAAQFTHPAQ